MYMLFMGSLSALDLPRKLLLTSLLAVLSAGFVVSDIYVLHTLTAAGGAAGLSLDSITNTFHGDRTTTPLKRKALGAMKRYFSAFEDATRLTAAEEADLARVVAWSDAGAPEAEYAGAVRPVLQRHGCLDCHAAGATTIGNKKDSPLDTYPALARFTRPDEGIPFGRLLLLSHIHLFGMCFIFLLTGAAVAATRFSSAARAALMAAGPAAVLLTVGGWWLVKYGGGEWSVLVAAAGVVMAVAFAASVLAALYDLWGREPAPAEHPRHGPGDGRRT